MYPEFTLLVNVKFRITFAAISDCTQNKNQAYSFSAVSIPMPTEQFNNSKNNIFISNFENQ